ncbi:uncharacterized protein [Periplaneta americana]|uniref:uncharacterized protein isoform X8 n=1 Tax=Periplaneta americana TaxID=6978 RepID=UPI0037E946EE
MSIQTNGNIDAEEKKPLSEEGNSIDLHVTEIKTECMDHSYDMKSEIFEETPVPIVFPIVKKESEEHCYKLDQVEKDVKLDAAAKEDEVLTERNYRLS